MTKTLLVFPRVARAQLICKWIETGNARQPLTCVWMDVLTGATLAAQELEPTEAADASGLRLRSGYLCA